MASSVQALEALLVKPVASRALLTDLRSEITSRATLTIAGRFDASFSKYTFFSYACSRHEELKSALTLSAPGSAGVAVSAILDFAGLVWHADIRQWLKYVAIFALVASVQAQGVTALAVLNFAHSVLTLEGLGAELVSRLVANLVSALILVQ